MTTPVRESTTADVMVAADEAMLRATPAVIDPKPAKRAGRSFRPARVSRLMITDRCGRRPCFVMVRRAVELSPGVGAAGGACEPGPFETSHTQAPPPPLLIGAVRESTFSLRSNTPAADPDAVRRSASLPALSGVSGLPWSGRGLPR